MRIRYPFSPITLKRADSHYQVDPKARSDSLSFAGRCRHSLARKGPPLFSLPLLQGKLRALPSCPRACSMISIHLHALFALAASVFFARVLPPILHTCLMLRERDMGRNGYHSSLGSGADTQYLDKYQERLRCAWLKLSLELPLVVFATPSVFYSC